MTKHPHAKRPEDDEPEPEDDPEKVPPAAPEGEPVKTQTWQLPG